MKYFFFSLVVVGIALTGMAIGVILSNKRIKGSCGGINALFGKEDDGCMFCDKKEECEDRKKKIQEAEASL